MELVDLLDDSMTFDGTLSKWGVSTPLKTGANLGGTSIQPAHLAALPVQQFTPGLVALTDANIVAAIEAARLYAVGQKGGRVIVPLGPHSGKWAIPAGTTIPSDIGTIMAGSKAGITFRACPTTFSPLWLESVPGGGFIVPADCDVGIYFTSSDGISGPNAIHHDGGMRHIWLEAAVGSQLTTAFRINAAVNCTFEKLDARSFDGTSGGVYGTGLRVSDDWAAKSGNSQFCKFEHVLCTANQINFDMHEISRSKFDHCNSQSGLHRSWLLSEGADVTVCNSGLQDGPTVYVEIVGNAFASFSDCYSEGTPSPSATLFKSSSITSESMLTVTRYITGVAIATAFDMDTNTVLFVTECLLPAVTKVFKAAPANDNNAGPYCFLNNEGFADAADALDAGKFDVNAFARARLYVARGGQVYSGGETIHGQQTRLASIAEGSESASPVAGQIHFNATQDRPRVRGASAFRDVALVDDPRNLIKLLAPYGESFDPGVYKKRSVISGELDQLLGSAGSACNAIDSTHRPTWNASDEFFAGRPSFSCDQTAGKYAKITTLAAAMAAGSRPGIFLVGRATGALLASPRRRFIDSSTIQLYGQDGDTGANQWACTNLGTTTPQGAAKSFTSDLNPHVFVAGTRAASGNNWTLVVDGDSTVIFNTADETGLTGSFSGPVGVGGYITGTPQAANATIAFFCLLYQPLPLSIEQRAIEMANSIFGLGL